MNKMELEIEILQQETKSRLNFEKINHNLANVQEKHYH